MRAVVIVLISSLFIGCMTSVNHLIAPEYPPTHISTKSSANQLAAPEYLPTPISTQSSTNHLIAPEHLPAHISTTHAMNDEVQRLLPPSDWLEKLPRKNVRR